MATWYSRTWKSGKVSWYTKVKDASGKWKPVLLRGVKNEPQAKKLAIEIEKERERAGHGLPATAPFTGNFAELCAWAMEIHFSKQGSAQPDGSRFKTHAGDLEKGTTTWLGALPVRRVTGPALAKYFAEAESQKTVRGKPPAASSINRLRAQFATVFELAKEHGYWVGENPVHATSARAVVQAGFDILEAHEIAPALAACDPYWRGCLAVGILAALRKGELFGLQKRDVDLARRVLMVRRSHGRETTKGGTHAPVPIHEDLVPYLEEWLGTPGPWLFPSHTGGRRSHQVDLPRILQTALVRAGFIDRWEFACRRQGCGFRDEQPHAPEQPVTRDCPECGFRLWATPRARNIRWHEGTRHTLASHAIMSGASLAGVQAILRHADPRLTIKTYSHLNAGFLGAEVNRVAVPGLAKASDTEQSRAISCEIAEPTQRVVHRVSPARGARMVRGEGAAHQRAGENVTNQHQNSGESGWSRGDLNPGPMHCEGKGGVSPLAVPVRSLSQVPGNSHPEPGSNSLPLPQFASLPLGRGAPMVRRTASAHHDSGSAYAGGSGRNPEHVTPPLGAPTEPPNGGVTGDLLTIQQVADRLAVGRTWVARRVRSGELPSEKAHPQAPALIPASALDAYLARFPGVVPPEPAGSDEGNQAPDSPSRKGAA